MGHGRVPVTSYWVSYPVCFPATFEPVGIGDVFLPVRQCDGISLPVSVPNPRGSVIMGLPGLELGPQEFCNSVNVSHKDVDVL